MNDLIREHVFIKDKKRREKYKDLRRASAEEIDNLDYLNRHRAVWLAFVDETG